MNLLIIGIVIILILTIYLYIRCYSVEKFQHQVYKSHIVKLKKEVLNPFKISCGKDSFMSNFFKVFSKKYPLILHNISGNSSKNLSLLNHGLTDICVTQLNLLESSYKGISPCE